MVFFNYSTWLTKRFSIQQRWIKDLGYFPWQSAYRIIIPLTYGVTSYILALHLCIMFSMIGPVRPILEPSKLCWKWSRIWPLSLYNLTKSVQDPLIIIFFTLSKIVNRFSALKSFSLNFDINGGKLAHWLDYNNQSMYYKASSEWNIVLRHIISSNGVTTCVICIT